MAETTKQQVHNVSREQLPVSCPPQGEDPAKAHPRVYIPLKRQGVAESCPYCGAEYVLKDA